MSLEVECVRCLVARLMTGFGRVTYPSTFIKDVSCIYICLLNVCLFCVRQSLKGKKIFSMTDEEPLKYSEKGIYGISFLVSVVTLVFFLGGEGAS